MGICVSTKRPSRGLPGSTPVKKRLQANAYSWDQNRQKDPNDYSLRDLKGETVIKNEIRGEQFNLENLEDCDIFLLDHSATVFLDLCKNCRVFIGPVESSFFARECSGCNLVVACQQFRLRDCHNCAVQLFCQTEPVIETSSEIKISCFTFSYFSLAGQFSGARLNIWCNKWSQVHDFNAKDGGSNWTISPPSSPLLKLEASGMEQDELDLPSVVPYTSASKDVAALVFFLPGTMNVLNVFLEHARTNKWVFTRTRSYGLKGAEAQALVGKNISAGETVGVEIAQQEDIFKNVESWVSAQQNSNVHLVTQDQLLSTCLAFFENLKDEV